MNLSEHVHVTGALHVELSVADRPELTRIIGVPLDAPSYWVVEAYRLSLGIEPELSEFEEGDDSSPLIRLTPWRADVQQISIPGVAEAVDVVISGPFKTRMGDPRVTVVNEGAAEATESPVLPPVVPRVVPVVPSLGAVVPSVRPVVPPVGQPVVPRGGQPVVPRGEQADPDGWQVRRPRFRAEHVAVELAQRFGLVQPHFSSLATQALGDGWRVPSPIAILSESLTPIRRLSLLAHLEESGLKDATRPDAGAMDSATEGLRMLVALMGTDGIEQDPADGWVPRDVVTEAVEALGWPEAAPAGLPRAGDALLALARRTKSIRRLRGRVVVTHLGRSLAAAEVSAFGRIVEVVRDVGRDGLFHSRQPRELTLALLAVADGSAATFDELPEIVACGAAAVAQSRGDTGQFSEWSLRPHQEWVGGRGTGDQRVVQRVVEVLYALSPPAAFGVITPAMRAVAGAALR